jgi:hypothetical protein
MVVQPCRLPHLKHDFGPRPSGAEVDSVVSP